MTPIPQQLMTDGELVRSIIDRLNDAVCTEGIDKGIMILSYHANGQFVDGLWKTDHEYFSPLGNALIDVFHGLKMLEERL